MDDSCIIPISLTVVTFGPVFTLLFPFFHTFINQLIASKIKVFVYIIYVYVLCIFIMYI